MLKPIFSPALQRRSSMTQISIAKNRNNIIQANSSDLCCSFVLIYFE